MLPDDFPTFLPVPKLDVPTSPPIAHLDIEHTNRVDNAQWKRDYLTAQAEMEIMRAEHKRDKTMYFTAGFLIGLAVPVGLFGNLITRFFG